MKIIFDKLKIALTILTVLSLSSCSEDIDFGNLSDTIFVRHQNADMPAYIHGNGSEKVFLITLHGGPGGIGLDFRATAFRSIENTCAVVYFDQRGAGMSQGNYSEEGINLDIMAEDVLALVKVMKKKYGDDSRFFLLGHSWVGTLGTAALLKNQSDFLGWISVDGNNNPKSLYTEYIANFTRVASEQIAMANSIDYWNSVNDLLREVDNTANQKDLRRLNNKAHQGERKLVDDNIFNKPSADGFNDNFFEYSLPTLFWNLRKSSSILDSQEIWKNVSFTNRLQEIKIPSLILSGKHDLIIPPSLAQETYDNIGSGIKELIIYERSGHSPMFSEADQFAADVILFIEQNK